MTMIYVSGALWGISLVALGWLTTVLIFRNFPRRLRNENEQKPLISKGMVKLVICLLIVLVLSSRHTFLSLAVFKADPNAPIWGQMIGEYLRVILLALIWPLNSVTLAAGICLLVLYRRNVQKIRQSRLLFRFNRTVFVSACLTFGVLFTTVYYLYRLGRIDSQLMYTVYLYAKAAALVTIMATCHLEMGTAGTGTGGGSLAHPSP